MLTKITSDYTGRAKDIFINLGVSPTTQGKQPVVVGFGYVSAVCAGVQKLVQRYMITFLTNLGSQDYFPEFGTEFLTSLYGSNLLPQSELVHLFNFANMRVLSVFRDWQGEHPDTPKDERLNSAMLQDYTIGTDSVEFEILLTTENGDDVNFVMPIPIISYGNS